MAVLYGSKGRVEVVELMAFMVTNQATIEAMGSRKNDAHHGLNVAEPTQWRALLQDLSVHPEGPSHLRITGVH
ncbi:hypothetical protein LguiA_018865 [Lonicera macranthoides]